MITNIVEYLDGSQDVVPIKDELRKALDEWKEDHKDRSVTENPCKEIEFPEGSIGARASTPSPLRSWGIGEQVCYVPRHARDYFGKPDMDHPDSEYGFIVRVPSSFPHSRYCRFFNKDGTLKNKSCSVLTPIELLIRHDKYPQERIFEILRELGETTSWEKP